MKNIHSYIIGRLAAPDSRHFTS